jgi:hypothetical protein
MVVKNFVLLNSTFHFFINNNTEDNDDLPAFIDAPHADTPVKYPIHYHNSPANFNTVCDITIPNITIMFHPMYSTNLYHALSDVLHPMFLTLLTEGIDPFAHTNMLLVSLAPFLQHSPVSKL